MSATDRIGILEVSALQQWVRSVAGGHFRVRFQADAPTACVTTDGDMIIPTPNARMTVRDAIRLRGFCLHETSHLMYQPEIFDLLKKYKIKNGSPLASVWNILLDLHGETMRAREWPGDAKALSEFGAVIGRDTYDNIVRAMKEQGKTAADFPEDFKKLGAVCRAARIGWTTWNVGLKLGFARLESEIYDDWMRDTGDEINRKFNLTDRLVVNGIDETGESIFGLAKEVYEWLWDTPAESQMGDPDGKGDGKGEKGEGEPKEGDGEPGSDAASEAKDSTDDSGKDGDSEAKAKDKILIKSLLHTDHYETMEGGGHGVGFDYTQYKSSESYTPVPFDQFIIKTYGRK